MNCAKEIIGKHGPKSALVLSDVTAAEYNKKVAEMIKQFVSVNAPFIRASAVIGADGVRQVLLSSVTFISR